MSFLSKEIKCIFFDLLTIKFFSQENCTYATIGGTCFRKKTHIELAMSLPRNVYKLGETIPVHVECSVKGGSLEVDKVTLIVRCSTS